MFCVDHLTPTGAVTVQVRVDKVSDLMSITETTYLKKGCGLPRKQEQLAEESGEDPGEEKEEGGGQDDVAAGEQQRRRGRRELGDLYVTVTPVWDDTPPTVWRHFLQVRRYLPRQQSGRQTHS